MSSQPPNPFSREGSGPEDGLGAPDSGGPADPWSSSASSGSKWPGSAGSPPAGGSAGSADEWPTAGSGGGSASGFGAGSSANPYSAGSPPSAAPWPAYPGSPEPTVPYGGSTPYPGSAGSAPGFDPQPTPPYDSGSGSSYGSPYSTASPYPASSYGDNPYEAPPYQASYGSVSPYGVPAVAHPQATLSMILGIVGVAACSLVGIAALVLGNKARKEIDAQPGRYSGRGMATAGFVLGIVSVAISVFWVLLFAIGLASGS